VYIHVVPRLHDVMSIKDVVMVPIKKEKVVHRDPMMIVKMVSYVFVRVY
jgi:hypothetical protein